MWRDAKYPVRRCSTGGGVRVTPHAAQVVNVTNVTYGQGMRCDQPSGCVPMDLNLDYYRPSGAPAAKRPAFILAHGGANSGGDREQGCFQGECGSGRGCHTRHR